MIVNENTYYNSKRQADELKADQARLDQEFSKSRLRLTQLTQELARNPAISAKDLGAALETARAAMEEDLEGAEEQLRLMLGQQAIRHRREIDALRGLFQSQSGQIDELQQRMDAVSKRVSRGFRDIEAGIKAERQRAIANEYQLNEVLAAITVLNPDKLEPLHQELLVPGFLAIQQGAAYVRSDIENGDFMPAIGVAQTLIPQALHMEAQLEILNEEFKALHDEAKTLRDQVLSQKDELLSSADGMVFQVRNGEYVNNKDVDYWTQGFYGIVSARLSETEDDLIECVDAMDSEGLRSVLSNLASVHAQLQACSSIFRIQFAASCACQETAYDIIEVLRTIWRLHSDGFYENDMRGAYIIRMTDSSSNNAVVTVSAAKQPDSCAKYSVAVDVDVFDCGERKDTPAMCGVIRKGIMQLLCQNGIPVNDGERESEPQAAQEDFLFQVVSRETKQRKAWLQAMRQSAHTLEIGEHKHG